MLITCTCRHCNGTIEFGSDEIGRTIACPKCGQETMLYGPARQALTTPAQPYLGSVQTRGRDSARWVKIISALCMFISVPGCMIGGFVSVLSILLFFGGLVGFIVGRFME